MLKDLSLESQKCGDSDEKQASLWKRIKFSFKSSEAAGLLAELEECNMMLERLSRAANQAKPYEKTQNAYRGHTTFKQRGEAERLFHILRKACKCQNAEPGRDVALGLQVPVRDDDNDLESKFQILLFDSQYALCELSARITKSEGPETPKEKSQNTAL